MGDGGALLPGSKFAGELEIVRRLAVGGMGAVYEVKQLTTGHTRALKVMNEAFAADPRMRERFVLEAKVGAQIQSDHVVQVIGAGVDDERPWVLMELLRGETLRAYVERRGPLPIEELGTIFTGICHAIAAAHAVGIVHRDLKPENVFLATPRRTDDLWDVKVLDFGIAKLVAESRGANTALLGTPFWMAPEQSEVGALISPATDVWALGLLAFHLHTGKIYWESAVGRATSAQIFREILLEPLALATVRAKALAAQVIPHVDFDRWFARCVDRDPTKRFASAREAQVAFQTYVHALMVVPTQIPAVVPPWSPMAATVVAPPPPPPPPSPAPPPSQAPPSSPSYMSAQATMPMLTPPAAITKADERVAAAVMVAPTSSARKPLLEAESKAPAPTPKWLIVITVIVTLAIGIWIVRDKLARQKKDDLPTERRPTGETVTKPASDPLGTTVTAVPCVAPVPPVPPVPPPTATAEAKIAASHIFVTWKGAKRSTSSRSKADARKLIDECAAKVKAGADFATLARTYSEDATNVKGGDLGHFGKGSMVKPFEDAAFLLAVGAVSPVVETEFGYHLIKRTE